MPSAFRQSNGLWIIGGGIVGLASAFALAEAGHQVTLVDDDPDGQAASWGNAGHIAAEQIEPLASPATLRAAPGMLLQRDSALALPPGAVRAWLPFILRTIRASTPKRFATGRTALASLLAGSMAAWKRLDARLGSLDLVRDDGHFILWESAASARKGIAKWQALSSASVRFRPATVEELERLTALTGHPSAGALRCLGSGHITSHDRLRSALHLALDKAGVRRISARARLERGLDQRCVVRLDGQAPVCPDMLLIAAGVGSQSLVEAIGHKVPMIAERGYHLHARGSEWPSDLPPVVFEDRSMIVTRFENGVRASSFVEMTAPGRPANPRRWESLWRKVNALGLPIEQDAKPWMGQRPTLPDYLPAIGRSRQIPNLLYAFGHQHLGLTLAPVTAEIVTALATGRAPAIDIAPFDLARFEGKIFA